VIVDSGSSTFAVAAAAALNCEPYYAGVCDGQRSGESYGDGSGFAARACTGANVSLAGLSAGQPTFAGILFELQFWPDGCSPDQAGISNQGILGMAWASLASAPYNEATLLDSVVATSGIEDVYSMQCCGWDGATAGSGTLVLGGVDASLYSGTIAYTPVTDQTYFCVTMTSPGFDDDSSCTNGNAIIDSGTSEITLVQAAYDEVAAPIAAAVSQQVGFNVTASDIGDYYYEASVVAALPNLELQFAGGVSLSIPPTSYMQPTPGSGDQCYSFFVSAAGSNIIGQAMMEAFYTVFDKANARVGFAPIANCPPRPASCAAAAAVVLPPEPPPNPPNAPWPSPAPSPPASCASCVAIAGHGWCPEQPDLCQPGDATGPASGTCAGGWRWYSFSCACESCTSYQEAESYGGTPEQVAGWCAATEQCALGDASGPSSGSCTAWVYETGACPTSPPLSPPLPPLAPVPTTSPTASPSASPTASPTASPSVSPTAAPTAAPVVVAMTAEGSVEDFNATVRDAIGAKVAAAAGVGLSDVNVAVVSASVRIVATVSVPPGTPSSAVAANLQSTVGSAAQASALLGISVTALTIGPAPAPPPPPQSTGVHGRHGHPIAIGIGAGLGAAALVGVLGATLWRVRSAWRSSGVQEHELAQARLVGQRAAPKESRARQPSRGSGRKAPPGSRLQVKSDSNNI
jgi:hypothetical protein